MNFLKRLEDIIGVRTESESRQFALSYDQRRTTMLRILRQIGIASQGGLMISLTQALPIQTHLTLASPVVPYLALPIETEVIWTRVHARGASRVTQV